MGHKSFIAKNHPSCIHSNKLEEDSILIAPLGKSPMVITQTFKLLSKNEGVNIQKVIVVHPKNAEIRNGVKALEDAFKKKLNLKPGSNFFQAVQIQEITDVASDSDCRIYLKKLVSVIKDAKTEHPDKSIHLSLSGGRKGMAALTLFAAQEANIDAVYHTLITDTCLEEKIEKETTLDELNKLPSDDQSRRLFLDDYDPSKFELFRVPVVPISIPTVQPKSVS